MLAIDPTDSESVAYFESSLTEALRDALSDPNSYILGSHREEAGRSTSGMAGQPTAGPLAMFSRSTAANPPWITPSRCWTRSWPSGGGAGSRAGVDGFAADARCGLWNGQGSGEPSRKDRTVRPAVRRRTRRRQACVSRPHAVPRRFPTPAGCRGGERGDAALFVGWMVRRWCWVRGGGGGRCRGRSGGRSRRPSRNRRGQARPHR